MIEGSERLFKIAAELLFLLPQPFDHPVLPGDRFAAQGVVAFGLLVLRHEQRAFGEKSQYVFLVGRSQGWIFRPRLGCP